MMGMDFDSFSYVPIRTLQKRVLGIDYILQMVHQLKNTNIAVADKQ